MCQKILVDADACPVKAEIKQVAEHFQLDVILWLLLTITL